MDTGLYTLYSTACEAIILFDNNPAGGTREGGSLGFLSASQAVSWVYRYPRTVYLQNNQIIYWYLQQVMISKNY